MINKIEYKITKYFYDIYLIKHNNVYNYLEIIQIIIYQ